MSRAYASAAAVMYASLLLAGLAIAQSPPAIIASPDAVVEETAKLLDQSIEGRRDELKQDKAALYALIDEILLPRFDRRYAAQLVLARHWRTASEEQRDQFIDAFYNNMMRLYADAVLEFNQRINRRLVFSDDPDHRQSGVFGR